MISSNYQILIVIIIGIIIIFLFYNSSENFTTTPTPTLNRNLATWRQTRSGNPPVRPPRSRSQPPGPQSRRRRSTLSWARAGRKSKKSVPWPNFKFQPGYGNGFSEILPPPGPRTCRTSCCPPRAWTWWHPWAPIYHITHTQTHTHTHTLTHSHTHTHTHT